MMKNMESDNFIGCIYIHSVKAEGILLPKLNKIRFTLDGTSGIEIEGQFASTSQAFWRDAGSLKLHSLHNPIVICVQDVENNEILSRLNLTDIIPDSSKAIHNISQNSSIGNLNISLELGYVPCSLLDCEDLLSTPLPSLPAIRTSKKAVPPPPITPRSNKPFPPGGPPPPSDVPPPRAVQFNGVVPPPSDLPPPPLPRVSPPKPLNEKKRSSLEEDDDDKQHFVPKYGNKLSSNFLGKQRNVYKSDGENMPEYIVSSQSLSSLSTNNSDNDIHNQEDDIEVDDTPIARFDRALSNVQKYRPPTVFSLESTQDDDALDMHVELNQLPPIEVNMQYQLVITINEAKELYGDVEGESVPDSFVVVHVENSWEQTTISTGPKPVFDYPMEIDIKDPSRATIDAYVFKLDGYMTIPIGFSTKQIHTIEEGKSSSWHALQYVYPNTYITGDIHLTISSESDDSGDTFLNVTVREARNIAYPKGDFESCYAEVLVSHIPNNTSTTQCITKKTELVSYENHHARWKDVLKFPTEVATSVKVILWKKDKKSKSEFLGQVTLTNVLLHGVDSYYSLQPRDEEISAQKDAALKTINQSYGSLRLTTDFRKNMIFSIDFYEPLLQTLDYNMLGIFKVLRKTTMKSDRASVSENLAKIYDQIGRTQSFIDLAIEEEVKAATKTETLFRTDTLSTKTVDTHLKLCGRKYLSEILQPTIEKIYSTNISFEIDPSKIPKGEDPRKNYIALIGYTKEILDKIYNSVDSCPLSIRCTMHKLQESVMKKFPQEPDARYICVSGFLFLRLFGPAIVSPKFFKLASEHPSNIAKTALGSVARTIQTIANMVKKPKKPGSNAATTSPEVELLEKFVAEEQLKTKQFIDSLSNISETGGSGSGSGSSSSSSSSLQTKSNNVNLTKELFLLLEHLNREIELLRQIAGVKIENPQQLVELQKGVEIDLLEMKSAKHLLKVLENLETKKNSSLEAYKVASQARKIQQKGRIFVYVTEGCPGCLRVMNILKSKSITYIPISISKYPQRKNEMQQLTGGKISVPQVLFNAKYIGGLEELEELDKTGKLDTELAKALNEDPPEIPTIPPDFFRKQQEESRKVSTLQTKSQIKAQQLFQELRHPQNSSEFRVGTHNIKLKTYKYCFKGQTLIDWLVANWAVMNEKQAYDLAMLLVTENYIYPLTKISNMAIVPKGLYRFYADDDRKVLNMNRIYHNIQSTFNPVDISAELQQIALKIVTLGNQNAEPSHDQTVIRFLELVHALQTVSLSKMNLDERKAFFINIYNVLFFHAINTFGPPGQRIKRDSFFNSVGFIIGGIKYTLNDIEHGILRSNARVPGSSQKKDTQFREDDTRLPFIIQPLDPRIHFALVNSARSNPPVRVYIQENVDRGLNWATECYVQDDIQIIKDEKKIMLSQLFKWYASDFGKSQDDILKFLIKHTPQTHPLKTYLKTIPISQWTIDFTNYDWDTNQRGYSDDDEDKDNNKLLEPNEVKKSRKTSHKKEDDDDNNSNVNSNSSGELLVPGNNSENRKSVKKPLLRSTSQKRVKDEINDQGTQSSSSSLSTTSSNVNNTSNHDDGEKNSSTTTSSNNSNPDIRVSSEDKRKQMKKQKSLGKKGMSDRQKKYFEFFTTIC
eukprot:TRINITY_DN1472_c3_g1_i1.p1 TRINITY_DN1472_c3_g1~~TRINITY_DN1472_c3_g1_i1.p1  ORF type:complete len:1623 (-),score=505.24 TRINITY_DN1472_c3_g1_i1:343-5211(-)